MANLKECKINGIDFRTVLFPVGSIYTTPGNTNPNSLIGIGTWSSLGSTTIGSTTVYFWKRTA